MICELCVVEVIPAVEALGRRGVVVGRFVFTILLCLVGRALNGLVWELPWCQIEWIVFFSTKLLSAEEKEHEA
jgi:hypothetical protein